VDAADSERLRDRERPVEEVKLRSDQLDANAAGPQRAQRERRFERGDAASGDEDGGAAPCLGNRTRHPCECRARALGLHPGFRGGATVDSADPDATRCSQFQRRSRSCERSSGLDSAAPSH
jgi:hypothetical protein